MTTPTQITRHNDVIQNAMDNMEDSLRSVTKSLENNIAEIILAKTSPNELISSRSEIDGAFTIFEEWARENVNELDPIAVDTIRQQVENDLSVPATQDDNRAVAELKSQSYARLVDTANTSKQEVMSTIVTGAIAGAVVADIAMNARHAISGLFITSRDREITALQRKIERLQARYDRRNDEINSLLSQLQKKFAGVRVGSNLHSTVSREMHDMVMDFDGVFTIHRAKQAGLEKFRYEGSVIRDSRDFCAIHTGKTYTEEEIRDIWNSQSWSGKRSGDPFIVRGGYNCRHFWVPVEN